MKALLAAAALVLIAPAAAHSPAAGDPTYSVRLYSYGYQPTPIVLRAGRQATIVFNNTAGIGHEFKAPAFFAASKIVSGPISEDGAVELKPHQSASVTLVPARGTFHVHCGHFMHKQLGMQALIYVE